MKPLLKFLAKTLAAFLAASFLVATPTTSLASMHDPALVQDINSSGDSYPQPLTTYDGKLIFTAYTPATGTELYSFDGSVVSLIETNPGPGGGICCNTPTEYNGKLYYMGETSDTGQELYVYDGSSVSLAVDINPGPGHSSPQELIVFNGFLYFRAYTPATGVELYKFDGVEVTLAADVRGTTASGFPESLTVWNGNLFFVAWSTSNGKELFAHDGTSTTLIDINVGSGSSSPTYLTAFNDKLYFSAYASSTLNTELYAYNGSTVSLIQDINPGNVSSSPQNLTVSGGKLYLRASSANYGDEIYVHDGAVTTLIDIVPGSGSGSPSSLTGFRNKLFFSARNDDVGRELWVYDGTGSPSIVQDIRAGSNSSYPGDLIVFEDKLYFAADDGNNGRELWVYDGTSATGFDLNPTGNGVDDFMFGLRIKATSLGLFFMANDGTTGFELWGIPPMPTPDPAPAPAPTPYFGPLPTSYSDVTPAVGDELTIYGLRLSTITSCTIDGISAAISNLSADSFTITIPDGTTTGLKNLVIASSHGILTDQGAFTVTEAAKPAEVVVPTAKTNAGSFNGYVAVYAKGHKGKTLSWKIAGKWFKTKITSDYQVFQRKTAALGLNVKVDLYVGGKRELSKTVLTR